MVFGSLLFLYRFLPVMLAAYFLTPVRYRNCTLFVGSLVFYAWGEPVYVLLLLFSTVADYIHGLLIAYFKERKKKNSACLVLLSSAVINLGLLIFFKYLKAAPLPVGISFYTFQTLSYTIDVYRGNTDEQKNLITFGAYVSMFPQLIAGPIVRYSTIAEELKSRYTDFADMGDGISQFMCGLSKKVLIANRIGALWEETGNCPFDSRSVLMLWIGVLAYGMQIYFDFSGYSDMACGLGRIFGFHFPENFHYPYCAESITDFWRKWHISLGTWFKEYVYIPLGGNKKGSGIQIRNIMIVWLLTGIWHGAGWNFLIWGGYFGVLLLLEKFVLKKFLMKIPLFFRHCYAVLLVFLGWVLFASENLLQALTYLKGMAGMNNLMLSNGRTVYMLITNLLLLAICIVGATEYPLRLYRKYLKKYRVILVVLSVLFCTAYLVNAGYNPFLYFRF